MQSALPGEIDKTFHHNLTSDSTLTLPHIQSCLEDIMQEMGISTTNLPTNSSIQAPIHMWYTAPELGHPLIDDNHERPLHPLVGQFLHEYLSGFEGMDDDDDEIMHLYTSLSHTRSLSLG